MTKLSTHLTLDTIKKSEKLQGIYPKKTDTHPEQPTTCPRITLADIIDNAEELFGSFKGDWKFKVFEIITMCQQDKPLQEIEEYIISNIK